MTLQYLHTMVRVKDLDASMTFFALLGLEETKRFDREDGRYSLVFMAPPGQPDCPVELTYNWDGDDGLPSDGRHFGHLAYRVGNIYEVCQRFLDAGYVVNRPPRDGYMAFVRSPDNISVELLQEGERLAPAEPWSSENPAPEAYPSIPRSPSTEIACPDVRRPRGLDRNNT